MTEASWRRHHGRAEEMVEAFHGFIRDGLICRSGDFFPAVHYPPITMYEPITEERLFEGYEMPRSGSFDIYVHLPFCQSQCEFCHYPIKLGHRPEEKDRYLDCLEKEYDLYLQRLGVARVKARSVLIGGGTPTYLSPRQLERFLESFTTRFDMSECTQFNYDLDPGTMIDADGEERLRILRDHGVDRLTIGLQSLDDTTLRRMKRTHTAAEAIKAVEASLRWGFKTNIEFIFGYPGQTVDSWARMFSGATLLGTEEIQLYRLKITPYGDRRGTVLRSHEAAPGDFPSHDDAIRMKRIAHLLMEDAGYTENLGRVFSRQRSDYSHYADNQCCRLLDQIGFGLTAFSSLRDRFGLNTQYFSEYYAAIDAGRLPLNRGRVRSREDQVRWAFALPLKNRELRTGDFRLQTGVDADQVFQAKRQRLEAHGLLETHPGRISPTPLGRFFADELVQQFYAANHIPFPQDAFNDGALNPYRDPEPGLS